MKLITAVLVMGVLFQNPLFGTDLMITVHVEAWTTGSGSQTLGHANGQNKVTAVNISAAHVGKSLLINGSLRHNPSIICDQPDNIPPGVCNASATLMATDTVAQCTNALSNKSTPGGFWTRGVVQITDGQNVLRTAGENSSCVAVMPNFI